MIKVVVLQKIPTTQTHRVLSPGALCKQGAPQEGGRQREGVVAIFNLVTLRVSAVVIDVAQLALFCKHVYSFDQLKSLQKQSSNRIDLASQKTTKTVFKLN